jgi:hypothetical protein
MKLHLQKSGIGTKNETLQFKIHIIRQDQKKP